MRVALIDDDREYLELMGEVLEERGWEFVICPRASEAVDCVRRESPDLVVLDLWLDEGHQGWEILEALQADPGTRNIPVIICSAVDTELRAHEAWLTERGTRMLAKPFDLDEFYATLDAAVEGNRTHTPS